MEAKWVQDSSGHNLKSNNFVEEVMAGFKKVGRPDSESGSGLTKDRVRAKRTVVGNLTNRDGARRQSSRKLCKSITIHHCSMIWIIEEFNQVHVLFSQPRSQKDFNHISLVLLAEAMFYLSGLSQLLKYYDQKYPMHWVFPIYFGGRKASGSINTNTPLLYFPTEEPVTFYWKW